MNTPNSIFNTKDLDEGMIYCTTNGSFVKRSGTYFKVHFRQDGSAYIGKEVPEDTVWGGLIGEIPIIYKKQE